MTALRPSRLTALLLLLGLCLSAAAQEKNAAIPASAERVTQLADQRINESSGLARSQRHPGVFWTLNDSGGEPCVFAIDTTGHTRAKVRLPHAVNFDWEDIASATDADGQPQLYIADIGDNLKVRPIIQVYQIPEPAIPAEHLDKEILSPEPRVWRALYPKKRHNAETLLVHPQTGRLYLVTKDDDGENTLYAFPETLTEGENMLLEKIVDIDFPSRPRLGKRPKDAELTTAGDISPDGRRLAISTYSYIHEWQLPSGQSLKDALKKPARLIEPPLTPQMEALCYDADSQTLWFTSERLPTPLYRLKP
ncbi:MAG: hypothetical protein RL015_3718 [Verrucomicrobiota bacterium]